MPAEQRIIGGGLLLLGVAIVLVLIYVLKGTGPSPEESREALLGRVWPAMGAAEAKGDYLEMQRVAKEALELLREGGSAHVLNYIEGVGTTDREAFRLRKAIEEKRFERNAEGLFEIEGAWLPSDVHRILARIRESVEKRLPLFRRLRETAAGLTTAIEEARVGSGMPLELPEGRAPAEDAPPMVDPNPVYENDRELFRVFLLPAANLAEALQKPDPKGKSTSARLRWNQNVVPGPLAGQLEGLTAELDSLAGALDSLEGEFRMAARDERGAPVAAILRRKAADALAAGLAPPRREAFEKSRALFEKPENFLRAMRKVVEAARGTMVNARDLGPLFRKPFPS